VKVVLHDGTNLGIELFPGGMGGGDDFRQAWSHSASRSPIKVYQLFVAISFHDSQASKLW
jgi:hypothetical protein